MAIVTDTVAVQRFAMGLFGVQVGTVTMAQVDKQIDRSSLSATLNSYYTSAFGGQTTAAVAATLVANLGITGAGVAGAVAYVTAKLNAAAPAARGEAINTILNDFSGMTADATYGAAAQTWNANVDVASGYTGAANIAFGSVIQQSLTAGMDILFGSAGADVFNAKVVANMVGQQVNTLTSGDEINGGAGTDTLNAKITAGASAGGDASMPIQPETKSVEVIKLEAVSSGVNGNDTQVYVNAKDMEGVSQLWSNRSDADLVVMNMTTKGTNQLSDMTIGMAYTGNKDSKWGASDYTVYFDQDYLTAAKTSTNPSVDFLAMNEDNYDATKGEKPLEGVYFQRLKFTLNGKSYDLAQYLGEKAEGKGDEIKTYAEFLTAVQGALVKLKAANAGDAALQTVTASLGRVFETDKDPATNVIRKGTAVQLTVDAQTGTTKNTLSVKETDLQVSKTDTATVPNSNRYEKAGATPALESDKPVTINVALEKVGLAGDGGELVIGSMNKTSENKWDAVKTSVSSTKAGIEQFNVTVSGDATKNSSLAALHSTNNMLKIVNVESAAGSTAKLTIGNSNTAGGVVNALKDVKTFDASKFDNGLTLGASITGESVAKYMSLTDTDAPAADNVNFVYSFGKGNDALTMNISKANLSAPGTTTREDFKLDINTGAGDDKVNVQIGDGTVAADSVWYHNSQLNANLAIDGGAGNDTISTKGSGDWKITAGEGDDTVYSDNSGAKAVWVFNTATKDEDGVELANLKSDANDSYNLHKGELTVGFRGLTSKVTINSTNYKTSDLQINQAIKAAINGDAVLSKLLKATDGPANTLVVTSLIDGGKVVNVDLSVSVAQPKTNVLSSDEITNAGKAYGLTGTVTEAQVLDAMEAALEDFLAAADYEAALATKFVPGVPGVAEVLDDPVTTAVNEAKPAIPEIPDTYSEISGTDSNEVTDSTHNLGAGNDVLVLSTGAETDLPSNETVVYNAAAFGNDVIVNFAATGNGIDKLDFTALGGKGAAFSATATTTDGLIIVKATPTADNTEAKVKAAVAAADDTTASKGIYVAVDVATNVGTVYQIVDGTATSDITATAIGTIDLADTPWSLTSANFA